ncbi:MAG: dNTP triphosphohydrolase [Chloroflexi bacterium]|nr:dNTP triphosphohydrolase [Chloroflexota bacterium]
MGARRTDRIYNQYDPQAVRGSFLREPFERDRERVIHTPALRRLAGVTQVVNATAGEIFHNRLTHTLKVAQIGRRLAERLLRLTEDKRILDRLGGLDPNVVEAAALAHDLGHPPFGHTGEAQLDALVREQGGDGFEGNAQSFRIVNKLEVRRWDIWGLNLTRATLNALLKYPWLMADQPQTSQYPLKKRKWGAYLSERWELNWVRGSSQNRRMSLEAQIMDWADDIAYAIHDMDDFYRPGLIPLDRLVTESTIHIASHDGAVHNYTQGERLQFLRAVADWRKDDGPGYSFDEIVEAFDQLMFLFPIFQPYHATREQQRVLRIINAQLINRYVDNTRLNLETYQNETEPLLLIAPQLVREVKILKDLTRYYVIGSNALSVQQYGQRKIIQTLFACYLGEALSPPHFRSPLLESILPPDFDTLLNEAEECAQKHGDGYATKEMRCARVVADVICRMTDEQAWKLYLRLTGSQLGSVVDQVT